MIMNEFFTPEKLEEARKRFSEEVAREMIARSQASLEEKKEECIACGS